MSERRDSFDDGFAAGVAFGFTLAAIVISIILIFVNPQ